MKAFIYLLQVSACTGIFYSFYFMVLRRYTFFTLNRWYLLATLLLSFVIPALTITLNTAEPSPMLQPVMYVQQIQTVQEPLMVVADEAEQQSGDVDWVAVLKIVYIGIAIASVVHLLVTLTLFFLRMGNIKLMQIGNVKVLKGNKKLGNSSFLNVIFINDDELEPEEIKQIITHEMLHVKLMHSADRLIARVIQIVLWFNPFAYCYIRSIEENHEFEVDRIAAGEDEKGMYAQLLFKLAVSGQSYLFHGFSKVPLKKRISMLFNKPTSNMKKVIYVLILPMVVISCLAFANLKDQPKKVSALGDLKSMGEHPLVKIDGKEYDSDILYTISGSCISGTSTYAAPADKRFGPKAKDGYIDISTKGKKITYMTKIEKENLVKEASLPDQFYSRIRLKNEDGTEFDKGIVRMPSGGKMSSDMATTEKPVFVIGDKQFSEAQIKEVEKYVNDHKMKSFGTGEIKFSKDPQIKNIKGHNTFFTFKNDPSAKQDTIGAVKYRQKEWNGGRKLTLEEIQKREKGRADFIAWRETDDYKEKLKAAQEIAYKTLTFKVVEFVDNGPSVFTKEGFKVVNNGKEYLLPTSFGPEKKLKDLISVGDELVVKLNGGGLISKGALVGITPLSVIRNNREIYKSAMVNVPLQPFLFEANRVRFTNGKLTNVQKFANGRWKSAVVEVAGGFRIKLNLKADAPAMNNIKPGDEVTFRFVHEVKTGTKEYAVTDWVSLSNNIKEYGVKNPDYFFKFYEKA